MPRRSGVVGNWGDWRSIVAVELTLGHSPDPDDAFMWWPLGTAGLEGGPMGAPVLAPALDLGRFRFRPVAADIQALNERAIERGDLDITALSMHAYGLVRDRYVLTDCGSSFGDGYGPKLLARGGGSSGGDGAGLGLRWLLETLAGGGRVAVPGFETTGHLVLRLMLGAAGEEAANRPLGEGFVEMRFDEIVPALLRGEVDAGLVIHEAQVTFASEGLALVADLGAWWSGETGGLPLPLGANAVRADLDERFGEGATVEVSRLLSASVEHAVANRGSGLAYAERFAVAGGAGGVGLKAVDEFVGLYVNEMTRSMGDRGRRAVEELIRRGEAAGLIPASGVGVRVV